MESQRTCKLFGVVRAVLGIKRSLPLIHGPVGCFYHIKYLLTMRSSTPIRMLCTEMNQNDVVFGAEQKLYQSIIKADREYSPEIIAVLTSCASSIIGENVEDVIRKVRPDINAEILALDSGGFEGDQIDGYHECLIGLVKLMNNDLVGDNSINLIAQYRGGPDLEVLKEYFKKLELNLNCVLTSGSTLNQIRSASAASLNISMCEASGSTPCKIMKDKFQIPFLEPTIPLGVNSTANFLREICIKLNKPYTLEKHEINAKTRLDKISKSLKNKKVVIISGSSRASALTEFCLELGMKPVIICLDLKVEKTLKKLKKIRQIKDLGTIISVEPEYSQLLNQVLVSEPDLIIGGMGEMNLAHETGLPLVDVMHARQHTWGFDGALNIAEKFKIALKDR